MKLRTVLLTICTIITQAKCQNQMNQDLIYFPTVPIQSEKQISSTQERDSYLIQPITPNDGHYASEPTIQNGNPQTNNDKAQGPVLSLELQPPVYNANSVHNYYSTPYDGINYNISTQLSDVGRVHKGNVLNQGNGIPRAITYFGLAMLKSMNQSGNNVVISPFSVSMLLALLQQGALGLTQQQISMALQMLPGTSADAFKNLSDEFQKRNSRNILKIANNLFVADVFDLSPAFKRTAMRNFGSEVTPTRFTTDTVAKINDWVADNTNKKIKDLLAPNAVGENTQLVLVNAVYFKGLWQIKFKPDSTLPKEFHVDSKITKLVPFMRMRRVFKVGIDRTNNAKVLILPFENDQYSLMLVMPSDVSSLSALIASITESQLLDYHNFSPKEVELEIPKFTVKSHTDLSIVLKNMGITNLFSQQSELSGVGTFRNYSPQVSSAVHTAMLSIDEEGGSAAAATAFAVVALSYDDPSFLFKANKPFLSVLWDNKSTVPLFMARIEDPTL